MSFFKRLRKAVRKVGKVVGKVASVAQFIPGPHVAIARGIATVDAARAGIKSGGIAGIASAVGAVAGGVGSRVGRLAGPAVKIARAASKVEGFAKRADLMRMAKGKPPKYNATAPTVPIATDAEAAAYGYDWIETEGLPQERESMNLNRVTGGPWGPGPSTASPRRRKRRKKARRKKSRRSGVRRKRRSTSSTRRRTSGRARTKRKGRKRTWGPSNPLYKWMKAKGKL